MQHLREYEQYIGLHVPTRRAAILVAGRAISFATYRKKRYTGIVGVDVGTELRLLT